MLSLERSLLWIGREGVIATRGRFGLSGRLGQAIAPAWRMVRWSRVEVLPRGALPGNGGYLHPLFEVFVVLFQVRFDFPVQAIAIYGDAPPSVRIGAFWEWTALHNRACNLRFRQ